ncbi:hypothetical protein [Actinomyces gaoshouyii]|uniref:hypothetical protein n=1 Tax=Actinomyces gaoshouyii TaxID=1960083 RepID=UPI0009BCA09A|nr:hypothetical protein [Actinomyces gaoshouyii]ARD42484.1 hypothetical protein B6G06_09150 [Actinomyces gaoshouyii]
MTAIDWRDGPVECVGGYGRQLRPKGAKETGKWAGTVAHKARRLCATCYERQRELTCEPQPYRMVWRWQMLADAPVLHQEYEAIADLMDVLREMGCVLAARPARRRVVHGATPFMELDYRIRDCTPAERTVLAPPQPDTPAGGTDVATVVTA